VQTEEREFIPIAALEDDLVVEDVKEAATAQAFGIAPFKNRPFAVGEQVFRDAKSFLPSRSPFQTWREFRRDRRLSDLVIRRAGSVQRGQAFNVSGIESLNPQFD